MVVSLNQGESMIADLPRSETKDPSPFILVLLTGRVPRGWSSGVESTWSKKAGLLERPWSLSLIPLFLTSLSPSA